MSGYNIFMIGYRAKLGLAPKESRDVSQLRTVADHLFLQAFSLLAQNQRFVPLSFTMKEDTHRNHWFQESYDSLSNIHSRREIGDLIETACFIGPGDTSTDSIPKAHRIKNNHVIEFRKLISEGIRQFGCHSEKGKPALLCPAQYPRSFSHRQFISGNVLGLDGNIDF